MTHQAMDCRLTTTTHCAMPTLWCSSATMKAVMYELRTKGTAAPNRRTANVGYPNYRHASAEGDRTPRLPAPEISGNHSELLLKIAELVS